MTVSKATLNRTVYKDSNNVQYETRPLMMRAEFDITRSSVTPGTPEAVLRTYMTAYPTIAKDLMTAIEAMVSTLGETL